MPKRDKDHVKNRFPTLEQKVLLENMIKAEKEEIKSEMHKENKIKSDSLLSLGKAEPKALYQTVYKGIVPRLLFSSESPPKNMMSQGVEEGSAKRIPEKRNIGQSM